MAKKKLLPLQLTNDEMFSIQRHDFKLKEKALEKQIAQLKQEIFFMKSNAELRLIQEAIDGRIKSNASYMKELANARGIEGKWSFNPDSGEIIKED